ncbi:MAG: peroxidase [Gemmatimonadota bacterium]
MPRIETVAVEDAIGPLKIDYDAAITRAGRVYNIVSLQSLNPPVMRASLRLYQTLMLGPGPLDRREREMLATVTARELDCFY